MWKRVTLRTTYWVCANPPLQSPAHFGLMTSLKLIFNENTGSYINPDKVEQTHPA